jgi:6-phospho-3-hexuloisomerase
MMNSETRSYEEYTDEVLKELRATLASVDPEKLKELIDLICSADKVFFVGVGRVMLSLQAITKRLAHLGIDAHYVGEITEPAIGKDDLLIVGSGSGESLFPVGIAKKAKSFGATIVHIGSNPKGSMAQYADLMVRLPVRTKLNLPGEIDSMQPMTSLFEQSLLLLGDIIAGLIIQQKGLDLKSLWQYHANLE